MPGDLASSTGGDPSRRAGGAADAGRADRLYEPWDKLVYVARGTVFCAIADVRPDSPSFAEVATFTLGDPPGERVRLWVSEGLGNAFCAVTEADYLYDVTAEWSPDVDKRAVAWDDPGLALDQLVDAPLLSDVDRVTPTLWERLPDQSRFAG